VRRLGVILTLLLLASAPASGAIHTYVVAANGTAVPNGTIGGIIPYSSVLLVAHGGVVYFAANIGGNDQWIYRWQDGKITLVTQLARDIVGDDNGSIAWVASGPDKCTFSLLAAGTSTPVRTGCTGGALLSVFGSGYTVMDGAVYYIGNEPGPNNQYGPAAVFRNQTPVAVIPDMLATAPPGIFDDGAGTIYLVGYYDGALYKVVAGAIVQVLPAGSNGFAASPGHLLYGGPTNLFDLSSAGAVNLSKDYGRLWLGKSGDVVLHQSDQLSFDRLLRIEPDGLHTIIGKGSKTVDGWSVLGFSQALATPHDDDGTTAVVAAIQKGNVQKQAVLAAIDECFVPKQVGQIPLDKQDQYDESYVAAHSLASFVAEVKRSIAALKADTKKHPAHRHVNDDAIHELQLQLGHAGSRSLAAHTHTADDNQDLVDNAKCSWLDDASKTLKEAAEGKHAKEISQLGDRLVDLKKVLNGDVKPGSPEAKKLLETNLVALGERYGGDNGGKLTSKALKLSNVLTGQIAQKDLPKTVKGEIADLAKVLGGKNAGELVTQITTLVDVLRGDVDADKQYAVLEESVKALATRIGVEGLLKAPQARAAMLGFQIGKVLGDKISVDLQLVADHELENACLQTLSLAQGGGHNWSDLDMHKKTAAFVPKDLSHPGWSCTIRPETDVAGYDNHTLIEAYLPPKIVLGFKLYDEQDIWFDPKIG
jgi:hypothetical protein